MRQYLDLLQHVLDNGVATEDRTGVGTLSVFGTQTRYDLRDGFPAVTTKRLAFKTMATELMWFVSGSTNAKDLQHHSCKIWDEWANEHGALGPVYGAQWREWETPDTDNFNHYVATYVDQLADLITQIKDNPQSRRHILSAWNVADLPNMALPPCHLLSQFYVRNSMLSCQLYQRSGDLFLGVPFNIASYALLTHIIAHLTGLEAGEFVHTIGDAHIYTNHVKQVKEQLAREPRPLPRLVLKEKALAASCIDDFALTRDTKIGDYFTLEGYDPHPTIKAEVAV